MPLTILRSHFRSLVSHRCSTNGYYLLPSRNFVVDSDHYYCLHVRLARCALNQVSETNALTHRSVPSSRSKRPLSRSDLNFQQTRRGRFDGGFGGIHYILYRNSGASVCVPPRDRPGKTTIPDVNVPAVLIEETRLDRLDPVGSTSIVVSC